MIPPPHLLSHLLLFLIILTTCSGSIPENPNTTACPLSNCGNNVTIRYPFWLMNDTRTNYCGYKGFGLSCSNDQSVLLLPNNDSFYVQNIDYTKYTLSLVDIDVTTSSCPRVRHNFTLNTSSLFFYSSVADQYLSFFFNCSDYPSSAVPLPCLEYDGKNSFMYVLDQVPDFDWLGNCEESVVVPVLQTLAVNLTISRDFNGALQSGFQLDWTSALDCSSCEESGGYCGYDDSSLKFLCFCKNGLHDKNCNDDSRKPNVKKKVIVGVCAGVGSFLMACFLCFFYYRRRGKRLASSQSTLLSSNYPSDSSLKRDLEKGSSNNFFTHIFSYKELEEATNNFDSSKELGDGGFGTVYHGKLRDGRSVAVKRLYENNYKRVEQFMNEVAILSGLRHQNLVSLYGCTSRHSRELLLVYEYVPNGTVADHLHGDRAKPEAPLTWPIRLSIAIETSEALSYLHAIEPQIIHRDVKTNNILLDSNFHVKVADFGLSRLFPMDVTHVSTAPQGTPGYVDPDYHQCYQLTDKSDVYSFGVVLMELISSMPAVDISRHRHEINLATMAMNKIQNRALHDLVDPKLGCESDSGVRRMVTLVAELGFRCLQLEKDMRPSMEEVVEILRGIESEGYQKVEKLTADSPSVADDAVLLKSVVPYSPNSVMEKLSSRSTTPNASG